MRSTTIKGFALGMVFGALMVAGAATAKAEPDRVTVAYAAQFAGAVCNVLDEYPSYAGIEGIAQAITADGLSMRQAGWVIALAVDEVCPRHTRLIMSYIDSGVGV